MSRAVATPLLVLVGLFWLTIGLLVAALVGDGLLAGVAPDDPQRGPLLIAAILLGGAVALIGASATVWMLARRASASAAPVWPGGVRPNSLRVDAVQPYRSAMGGRTSPVPPTPNRLLGSPGAMRASSPTASPPPPPTAWVGARPPVGTAARAPSTQRATGPRSQAPMPRARAPIPGATTVGPQAPAPPTDDRFVTAPARAVPVASAIALFAGIVFSVEVATSDSLSTSGLILPIALLLVAGAAAPRDPLAGSGNSALRLALIAALPFTLAAALAVANGQIDVGTAAVEVVVSLVCAWLVAALGAAAGRRRSGVRRG